MKDETGTDLSADFTSHRCLAGVILTVMVVCPMLEPTARKARADEPSRAGYKTGHYVKAADDTHALHFRFLFQPQYEYVDADEGKGSNGFLVKRAQLRMFGNALTPRLKYKMMIMATTTPEGGSNLDLRDLRIDWQWTEYFQVTVGQFFVYFDYEDLQPTWALPLVDRSIINANLGFERDIGIRVHGRTLSHRLGYQMYMMNGDGRNALNAGDGFFYGARLDCQIMGAHQFVLPDVEKSAAPHLALGMAFLHDSGKADLNNNKLHRLTADLTFRYEGFSALSLANLAYNEDKSVTDYGLSGQLGCFVVAEHLETVARWAKVLKDGALGAADTGDPQEVAVGLNWYIEGHTAKVQVDYSRLWNNASTQGRDDNRVRAQVQLFF